MLPHIRSWVSGVLLSPPVELFLLFASELLSQGLSANPLATHSPASPVLAVFAQKGPKFEQAQHFPGPRLRGNSKRPQCVAALGAQELLQAALQSGLESCKDCKSDAEIELLNCSKTAKWPQVGREQQLSEHRCPSCGGTPRLSAAADTAGCCWQLNLRCTAFF